MTEEVIAHMRARIARTRRVISLAHAEEDCGSGSYDRGGRGRHSPVRGNGGSGLEWGAKCGAILAHTRTTSRL